MSQLQFDPQTSDFSCFGPNLAKIKGMLLYRPAVRVYLFR